MSDQNTSLPVRTESAGDIIAKIADATTPSQQLAIDTSGFIGVKEHDASGTGITSTLVSGKQGLDVNVVNSNVAVTVGVADKSAFTYGTTVQDVIGGVYQDTSPTLTAGQQGAVRLTQYRAIHANLRDAAGNQLGDSNADGLWIKSGDGTNSQSYTASGEAKVDITQPIPAGTNLIGKATISQGGNDASVTGSNALKVDGSAVTQPVSGTITANQGGAPWSQNLTQVGGSSIALGQAAMAASMPVVIASNQTAISENISQISGSAPSASNSLPVQISTGSAYVSSSNPLPVIIDPAGAGTAVWNYKAASSVAGGASDNHDYTVTSGKTLHLRQIEASASGKAKMVLQIETGVATGVFTSYASQFNSTANPNISFSAQSEQLVAAGVRVRVVMSNREAIADDLYSTIIGFEI